MTDMTDMKNDRTQPLFVYGTLLFDEIVRSLIGRTPAFRPATALGYEARMLRGVSYPGLVAVQGGRTEGLVFDDLSLTEWVALDEYEDDFYTVTEIEVLMEGGLSASALAYLVEGSMATPMIWTPAWFRSRHLSAFLGDLSR